MQHAEPIITSGTGRFKAVCHKCHYVGFEPNTTTCRNCGFPLLLETAGTERLSVHDILDRSSIETKGERKAPHLPGVNRSQRQKDQMLENARRRLSQASISRPVLVDATPVPQAPSSHRPAPASSTGAMGPAQGLSLAGAYAIHGGPGSVATVPRSTRSRAGMLFAVVCAVTTVLATVAACGI